MITDLTCTAPSSLCLPALASCSALSPTKSPATAPSPATQNTATLSWNACKWELYNVCDQFVNPCYNVNLISIPDTRQITEESLVSLCWRPGGDQI